MSVSYTHLHQVPNDPSQYPEFRSTRGTASWQQYPESRSAGGTNKIQSAVYLNTRVRFIDTQTGF